VAAEAAFAFVGLPRVFPFREEAEAGALAEALPAITLLADSRGGSLA
jgi:hypothetical protein